MEKRCCVIAAIFLRLRRPCTKYAYERGQAVVLSDVHMTHFRIVDV